MAEKNGRELPSLSPASAFLASLFIAGLHYLLSWSLEQDSKEGGIKQCIGIITGVRGQFLKILY